MRRKAISQRTEAHRQHINTERVRLTELQYTITILRQQKQRQELTLNQRQHQPERQPTPTISTPHPYPSTTSAIQQHHVSSTTTSAT
jgi:hypothetical protein